MGIRLQVSISCQLQVCYFPAHHLAPGHVKFSRNMKSLIFTIPIERGQQLVNCTEKGREVVFICPESRLAPSQDSVYKMNAHLPCAIYSTDIFNLFYITYLENSFSHSYFSLLRHFKLLKNWTKNYIISHCISERQEF